MRVTLKTNRIVEHIGKQVYQDLRPVKFFFFFGVANTSLASVFLNSLVHNWHVFATRLKRLPLFQSFSSFIET